MIQISEKLRQKCGIYSIFNYVNGKRYIGSSKELYNRFYEHLYNLRNQKSHNKHLQSAWNKYGEDAFIFEVLEYCNVDKQFEREQFFMDFMCPEYNLTPQVVACVGRTLSTEEKQKISNTLKVKYASKEISTYKQEHNWRTCYIYNIKTLKLEAECKNVTDAVALVSNKKAPSYNDIKNHLYRERYCITEEFFNNKVDLINYINKNILKCKSSKGTYLIAETKDGNISYYRSIAEAARCNFVSVPSITKGAGLNKPYTYQKTKTKFYFTNDFIPIIGTAVPIEKSSELLSGNIGESPEGDNTEINLGVKEPKSSYSIGDETQSENIILPRVSDT